MHLHPAAQSRRGDRPIHGALAACLLCLGVALPSPAQPAAATDTAPATDPVAAASASAEEAGTSTPSASIDALHASLLDVMRRAETLGYAGRERMLAEVIPHYFDVDFMARKSLGRHWKQADEAGRERYLSKFKRFMVANYAGRFDGFSGQSFVTEGEEPARSNTVVVKTRLLDPGGENVALNYRMREVKGRWKIIDVYLDGTVSELALRRSEFVSIVKRDDLEALLVALDAKIAKLAAGKES